ncbi:MAG: hypothetical protein RLZZ572_559 [Pseudomonadota bacterium]|jgi:hypothetical protein
MRPLLQLISLTLTLALSTHALADNGLSFIKPGLIHLNLRPSLLAKGWQPVPNRTIENSSLYAQEMHALGLIEVVDCISMEIDACTFQYRKKNQVLTIKTITRQAEVASFKVKTLP